jgi:hypothetical protein
MAEFFASQAIGLRRLSAGQETVVGAARDQHKLQTILPLPMIPEQEAEWLAWREKVKDFNLETVREELGFARKGGTR